MGHSSSQNAAALATHHLRGKGFSRRPGCEKWLRLSELPRDIAKNVPFFKPLIFAGTYHASGSHISVYIEKNPFVFFFNSHLLGESVLNQFPVCAIYNAKPAKLGPAMQLPGSYSNGPAPRPQ